MSLTSLPRRATLAAATVSVALIVTGCSSSPSPGDADSQTLTLAYSTTNPTDTYIADSVAAFEAANPGVTVEERKLPAESYATTIQTQLQGGNAPDVFSAFSGAGQVAAVQELAKADLLLDLGDLSLDSRLPESIRSLYQSNDGTYIGIPQSSMPVGLVYNDAKARELGIQLDASSTFDDLIAACSTARDAGVSLSAVAGTVPSNPAIMTMTIATSTVYGPDPEWNAERAAGETTFAETPGWVEALQAVSDMNDAGCFQEGAAGAAFDGLIGGMAQGKALSFYAPGGAAKSISDGTKGAVSPILLPMPSPTGESYLQQSVDLAFAGNAKTKNPELVRRFLDFMSTPAGADVLAEKQGTLPAISDSTGFTAPEAFSDVSELIASDQTRPSGQTQWPNAKIYDALGSGVAGILIDSKTPQDVLKDMDAAWG